MSEVAPAPPVRWRATSREIGGFYTFLKPEVEKLRAAQLNMNTHAMKQCDVLLKEYVSSNQYIQQLFFQHQKEKKFGDSRYPQAHRYSEVRPRFKSVWDSSPAAVRRPTSRQSVRSTGSSGHQSSDGASVKIMSKNPERDRRKSAEEAQNRNPERSSRKSPELIRYRSPDSNPERPRNRSPHRISEGSPFKYRKGNQYRVPEEAFDKSMLTPGDDGERLSSVHAASETGGEVVRFLVRPPEESSAETESLTARSTTPGNYTRSGCVSSPAALKRPVAEGSRAADASYVGIFESSQPPPAAQLEGFEKSPEASRIRELFEEVIPARSKTPGSAQAGDGGTEANTSSSGARKSGRSPRPQQNSTTTTTTAGENRVEDEEYSYRMVRGDPPPHRSDPTIESSSCSSQSAPPQKKTPPESYTSRHSTSSGKLPMEGIYTYKLPAGGSYRMPELPCKMPEAKPKEGDVYVIADGNQYRTRSETRSLHHIQVGDLLQGSPSRTPEQERSRTRTPESSLAPQKRRKKHLPHRCDVRELVPEQRTMKRKPAPNKVPETKKYTFYKYYGKRGYKIPGEIGIA